MPQSTSLSNECKSTGAAVDFFGIRFELAKQAAVVEAGSRFGLVGETRAQVCVLVGADDAEISQREVLEIILRLPEIKVQHELDRLCIAQRDELAPTAIIMCCFEGDVCEKIFDQFRLGPGGPNIGKSCVLPAFDQGPFGVAEDEVGVIAFDQSTHKVTISQFF